MVLVDTKKEEELKLQGIRRTWVYGNTWFEGVRQSPHIKFDGLFLGEHGSLEISCPCKSITKDASGLFSFYWNIYGRFASHRFLRNEIRH